MVKSNHYALIQMILLLLGKQTISFDFMYKYSKARCIPNNVNIHGAHLQGEAVRLWEGGREGAAAEQEYLHTKQCKHFKKSIHTAVLDLQLTRFSHWW